MRVTFSSHGWSGATHLCGRSLICQKPCKIWTTRTGQSSFWLRLKKRTWRTSRFTIACCSSIERPATSHKFTQRINGFDPLASEASIGGLQHRYSWWPELLIRASFCRIEDARRKEYRHRLPNSLWLPLCPLLNDRRGHNSELVRHQIHHSSFSHCDYCCQYADRQSGKAHLQLQPASGATVETNGPTPCRQIVWDIIDTSAECQRTTL